MPAICPKCNNDDMSKKVKAVYSGGVSSGQYSGSSIGIGIFTNDGTPSVIGGNTNRVGTSQTLLSRRLSPPPQPSIIDGLRPAIIVVLVLVAVVDCNIAWNANMILTMYPGGTKYNQGLITIAISLILAGLFLYLLYKAEKPKFETAQIRWQSMLKRWDDLYYCERDDCVFDPDSGKSVPADNMSALLEETIG